MLAAQSLQVLKKGMVITVKKNVQLVIIMFIIISTTLLSDNSAYAAKKSVTDDITLEIMSTNSKSEISLSPKYEESNGLYGYVDKKGKWIIEPKFLSAKPFSEGLAAVLEDSEALKWGYIQPNGTFSIKPQYTAAYEFKDSFAIVTDDNSYVSTIDKKGKPIQKSKYYLSQVGIGNTRATISNGENYTGKDNLKYGVITEKGTFIKPEYDGMPSYVKPFVCLFKEDASGDILKRTHYIVLDKGTKKLPGEIISVSEGIGLIEYRSDKYPNRKNLYAYLTSKGKLIKSYSPSKGVEYPFVEAKGFSEGYAAIAINHGNGDIFFDQWGFLKKDGTWLNIPEFTCADSFKNGVAPVKEFNSWGYIKTDLTWFIKPYEVTKEQLKKENDYCVKEAKSILKDIINDSMSDYEKLDKIYDYVTHEIYYDSNTNIPRVSHTAYGALKYKIAVCDGYAEALHILLDLAGVENIIIHGADKLNGIGHAWNLVKINGKYYHVDSTGDSSSPNQRNFFMLSDDQAGRYLTWKTKNYPAAPTRYK